MTVLQEDFTQTMTDNSLSKGFDLFSATANVRAYQAKLLEMAQANMTFAFEFSLRLATIRSPVEFPTSLQNSQVSGSPCSVSIRKRWLN